MKRLGTWLVAGFCFLSPLTDLRVADIQSIEVFGLGCLLIAYGFFAQNEWRITVPKPLGNLLRLYALLMLTIVVLATAALRLQAYPPFTLPLLKTPPLLSIARITQMAVCIGGFLLLVFTLVRRPSLIPLAAQLYVWSGLASAGYALLSFAAWHIGIQLPGAYYVSFIRARAFFVEGGPFGVYLVSVIAVACFRAAQFGQPKHNCALQVSIIFMALVAAQSKAALLLGALILTYWQFADRRYSRLVLGAVLVAPAFVFIVAQGGIGNYVRIILNFDEVIQTHADDTSFAMGRIMAAVLAPRMIAEHPILGIGIGNYSLQRNNPKLLDGLPTTSGWDLPGLGYIGYAAELGIPCTLFLLWLIWAPAHIAGKRRVNATCIALIAYQFFAHLFGAQITFAYPWVTTSIGLAYALTQPEGQRITGGRPFRLVWRSSRTTHSTTFTDSSNG